MRINLRCYAAECWRLLWHPQGAGEAVPNYWGKGLRWLVENVEISQGQKLLAVRQALQGALPRNEAPFTWGPRELQIRYRMRDSEKPIEIGIAIVTPRLGCESRVR